MKCLVKEGNKMLKLFENNRENRHQIARIKEESRDHRKKNTRREEEWLSKVREPKISTTDTWQQNRKEAPSTTNLLYHVQQPCHYYQNLLDNKIKVELWFSKEHPIHWLICMVWPSLHLLCRVSPGSPSPPAYFWTPYLMSAGLLSPL